MASGPYFNPKRGTYAVQWFDGRRWRRHVVHKLPGWKQGQEPPKKIPTQATEGLVAYAKKEKAARQSKAVDPTLSVVDFLENYRVVYAQSATTGSQGELAKAVRLFLAWCKDAKIVRLEQVTAAVCQRWMDQRASMISRKTGRPISPARLAQERALLATAWARATRLGEIPKNPWLPVQAPGWDKARKARKHKPSWSPEDFAKLIAVCRPWLRDILIVGTQTGLRISALLGLEWRDVHWAKDGPGFGRIEVRPESDKAGKGYTVPISKKCHDVLARRFIHREAHVKLVLTGMGGQTGSLNTTATAIIRACARAGLPKPTSPNHHMRRTFGRWAVMGHLTGRPVPLYVVSRWMGHSSVQITETYLDVHHDESADWMTEFEPRRSLGGSNASEGQDPVSE